MDILEIIFLFSFVVPFSVLFLYYLRRCISSLDDIIKDMEKEGK